MSFKSKGIEQTRLPSSIMVGHLSKIVLRGPGFLLKFPLMGPKRRNLVVKRGSPGSFLF